MTYFVAHIPTRKCDTHATAHPALYHIFGCISFGSITHRMCAKPRIYTRKNYKFRTQLDLREYKSPCAENLCADCLWLCVARLSVGHRTREKTTKLYNAHIIGIALTFQLALRRFALKKADVCRTRPSSVQ